MKNLRLRLAQWIAPKGFLVILESLLPKGFGKAGFTDIPYYKGKPIERDNMGHNPTLQEQFDGLADVVDDGTDVAEYGGIITASSLAAELDKIVEDVNGPRPVMLPNHLWKEVRKQLVEEKQDDRQA